jgi:starch synthase
MENIKVLFISQEITPYLPETEMSVICRNLPQGIQERGKEIRTFMPRYGCINERRNQLHEVIRLSGMNLVIDDTDHPLIIKVASIQAARMQVYFIDNEDYFNRKYTLKNDNEESFPDNDERAIFFTRGVIETVKKLRWSPDVIHCHGWITALTPMYIKKLYHDDPLFAKSKVVYSIYEEGFHDSMDVAFRGKLLQDGLQTKDTAILEKPNWENLNKLAISYSDAVVMGSPTEKIDENLKEYLFATNKPILYHKDVDYADDYSIFYDKLVAQHA